MLKHAMTALCLTAATHAQAQDNYCNVPPADWATVVAEDMVGVWTGQNGAGLMQIAHLTQPIPPSEDSIVTFSMIGGELAYASDTGGADFDVRFAVDEEWTMGRDPTSAFAALSTIGNSSLAPINEDDLAITFGCEAHQLPRIVVSGQLNVGGGQVDITIRGFVLSPSFVYGVGEFAVTRDGHAITGKRIMSLTR